MSRELARTADVCSEVCEAECRLVAIKNSDSSQVLPIFRLDTNLYQVIFKQNSIVFADKSVNRESTMKLSGMKRSIKLS